MIRRTWRKLVDLLEIKKPGRRSPYAAATLFKRNMLRVCPACKLSLESHAWATLAEAGNKEDMTRLLELFRAREWANLRAIHSFEGTKNAIIASAIKCPTGRGYTFWYVDPVEIYANHEFGEDCAHDPDQWKAFLEATMELEWHPF